MALDCCDPAPQQRTDRYLQLNTIGNAGIRPASSSTGVLDGRMDVALPGGTVSGNEAPIETAG